MDAGSGRRSPDPLPAIPPPKENKITIGTKLLIALSGITILIDTEIDDRV
jgi:hypothetical protein